MPKTRICIADDHNLFRDGLVQLINGQPDMEVVGVAGDDLEMLTQVRKQKPGLIFMDISMPISDGIESVSLIREFDPAVKILMLTALDDDEKMIEAIKAGANGYLLKNTSSEGFLPCALVTVPNHGQPFEFTPLPILRGRSLVGELEGGSDPDRFIPWLMDLHLRGLLPFDRFCRRYRFDDLPLALADATAGRAIKPIIC